MYFGVASEGVTDQVFIEYLMCGFFEDDDLEQHINQLQPAFDESTKKQADFGGWPTLFTYLKSTRFRDDVLNCKYFILQVDTDVSELKGFDVPHIDEKNQPYPPDILINKVISRIITIINLDSPNFYEANNDKFIFCIAINSIECWINSYYDPHSKKTHKIVNCAKALEYNLTNQNGKWKYNKKDFNKNHDFYSEISEPFLEKENILNSALLAPSLNFFIDQLKNVVLP